jgi:hypothetical protein
MKKTNFLPASLLFVAILIRLISGAQETEVRYLSGTGIDDAVDWEFMCTDGRQSGAWTTIPVPSCWELHGFGNYNYGNDKDEIRGKEKGLYRHRFEVPADWKGKSVHIVFEGSMTDTEVKINGKPAGPVHQGAFYRFSFDIGKLVRYGRENLLEVTVAKHSANESVNEAERRADYWIFGGIFRPVYLEARPAAHITRIALDARADGSLTVFAYHNQPKGATHISAQVHTLAGEKTGDAFTSEIQGTETLLSAKLHDIDTWNPEFPNLYLLEVSLMQDNQVLHTVRERFGFRTVELRERDGFYVNGVKVRMKGVNRHSFRPQSGRTLGKAESIEDVKLIREMNMNAVRMSHYPPDKHFLEVCDSHGLFVLNELAGWQTAYDTEAGSILAREMIMRDVNHPSVVIWDNGNEGGWNTGLDHWFDELDPQKRPLIHPWDIFRGTDTQHYKDYDYGSGTHQHGRNVVFPTEFLHGLYDGGHGAGLEDFWNQMCRNPLSAGGFLWVLADEGVVRTDRENAIDTDGNHAPDGIVGPYHEKEGSFYAIKEIWSPVFIERTYITPQFSGQLQIENRYHYTNLNQCTFSYRLEKIGWTEEASAPVTGQVGAPDIEPGHKGLLHLGLPGNFAEYDVLYLTAHDPRGEEIYTWSWPVTMPDAFVKRVVDTELSGTARVSETETEIRLTGGGVTAVFGKNDGLLRSVSNQQGSFSFGNGPVPAQGEAKFREVGVTEADGKVMLDMKYDGYFRDLKWVMHPSGWLQLKVNYLPGYQSDAMGISFNLPEEQVRSMRYVGSGPYRVWKNRLKGNAFGMWQKDYNNTITGEGTLVYPEFKGYHKDFYAVEIETAGQPFTILCGSEDVFLRMLTPEPPKGAGNSNNAPFFPSGDISFLHGISAIGTKFKKAEALGPMSQKNIFYTQGRKFYKELDIWLDFRGRQ